MDVETVVEVKCDEETDDAESVTLEITATGPSVHVVKFETVEVTCHPASSTSTDS